MAIAKGDVPTRHWFRLGRTETPVGWGSALVSWSGSMFEYLMPSLVMRAPAREACSSRATASSSSGRLNMAPNLASRGAYRNPRTMCGICELTYQYSSFGVPGLGLKRGLSQDAVIAPYATALAAMVDPQAAARNFLRLAAAGGRGRYGWYEALDYTPARLPEGAQGGDRPLLHGAPSRDDLVAIANALHDGAMRARFHAEPIIQATQLLLQERIPRDVLVAHPGAERGGGNG